jgi:hypothetical protein
MWLCNNCEQEFLLFKTRKTMQKELEYIRDDMNKKLDTVTAEIQKLRIHTQEPSRERVIKTPKRQLKQKPTIEKDERQQTRQHPPHNQKGSEQRQPEEATPQTSPIQKATEKDDPTVERNGQHNHHTEVDTEESLLHNGEHRRRQRRRDAREAADGTNNNEQEKHSTEADADVAPHHSEEEDEWSQAQHGRRQGRRGAMDAVIGINNCAGEIQAAEQRAWLFVGKLEKSTTAENIIAYMSKRGIPGNIECDELKIIGDKKAFKVGITYTSFNSVSKPEFWPTGILMRSFRLSRRQRNYGISL